MVNVHFLNAEVERVARPQRNRSDGIVATQRTTKHVPNASTLARTEVQLHLVQSASQFHFVRNVVVDIEHLSLAIAAVGDEQFHIQVIALVQVIGGQRALNFHIAVS